MSGDIRVPADGNVVDAPTPVLGVVHDYEPTFGFGHWPELPHQNGELVVGLLDGRLLGLFREDDAAEAEGHESQKYEDERPRRRTGVFSHLSSVTKSRVVNPAGSQRANPCKIYYSTKVL